MGKLEGKVALVTGAAVGIGREIATVLGAEGAAVAVNYSRSRAEAEATAEAVRSAGGEPHLAQADVADDAAVRAMVAQVEDRFGRIDILVNNAGVTERMPFGELDALTDDIWDRLYSVNVKGMFHCARAVTPGMRRHGEGRILNIGSVAGLRPTGSSIAYCASKAAMTQVSNCLAKTLAPEIRVNLIAPGFIDDTRWNEGYAELPRVREAARTGTPLARVGRPSDIAEAALFFAAGADFLTGSVLVVDGGRQYFQ